MDINMTPEQAACAEMVAGLEVSPTNPNKRVAHRALAHDVMAVAHIWPAAGDFRVYIGTVPGRSHPMEVAEVLDHGTQVQEDIARAIFPRLDALTYWRF